MNIFQKLGELTSRNSGYHDVATALERLRKSGKPVTVKFENDSRSYSSRITAFNREHKIFVLDNIFPAVAGETFRKGRIATISSTDNHKTVSLTSVCLEPLVKNQDMGYEMRVSSALNIVEFERDYDFGLHHFESSKASNTRQKAVGF